MIRRAALASVLLIVLSTASVSAGGSPIVQMQSSSFSPAGLNVVVGETVTWNNNSGLTHTTTADRFNQWDRTVSNNFQTDVLFARAGNWTYHCEIHAGMTGKVKVRPTASPSSGTTMTLFFIRAATVNPPTGFVMDIQRRKPGGVFKLWRTTSGQGASTTLGTAGTWQFRARTRKTSNDRATGWGSVLAVVVN